MMSWLSHIKCSVELQEEIQVYFLTQKKATYWPTVILGYPENLVHWAQQ